MFKNLRLLARLTQEELAARAGLSVRTVRDIERGRVRCPRPETVRLLGTALSLDNSDMAAFVARSQDNYWNTRGEPPTADPVPAATDATVDAQRGASAGPCPGPDPVGRDDAARHDRGLGQAVGAWLAVLGHDPDRAPGRSTATACVDVADQLADAALAALVAIDQLGHDPREALIASLRRNLAAVGSADAPIGASADPAPDLLANRPLSPYRRRRRRAAGTRRSRLEPAAERPVV